MKIERKSRVLLLPWALPPPPPPGLRRRPSIPSKGHVLTTLSLARSALVPKQTGGVFSYLALYNAVVTGVALPVIAWSPRGGTRGSQ